MRAFAAFLIVASATAAALAFVATTADPAPPGAPARPAPRATATPPGAVNPGALLDRAPYLGVACPRASSTRCDRIGVAIWTRHGVERLRARVGGRAIDLPYAGTASGVPMFVGYLDPAGLRSLRVPLRWDGDPPRSMRVRLWAERGDGTQTTTLRVPLHPGWG